MQYTKSSPRHSMTMVTAVIAVILLFSLSAFATQTKQTVTFTGAPATAAYQSTFTVTATSNSGETATITAAGPCTISGDTVTMTSGTGTCTLTASWPANTTYLAATATQKSTATKLKPTVTFTGAPAKAFALSTFNVASTSNAGETSTITATGACTVSGDTVTMTSGTGSCSLKASWVTNSDYLAATATQATAAEKLTQVVTFTGAPATAPNESSFTVAATTNDGTTPTITATGSCTISGDTVTITENTGVCTTTASWAATADYLAATAKQTTTAEVGYSGSVIYNFGTNSPDAENPFGNGMVMDKLGNIYGSSKFGGEFLNCSGSGDGIIFELSPKEGGGWTETVIHQFNMLSTSGGNGCQPSGQLAMDSTGNLYGTTTGGGANNLGSVYKLTNTSGVWTETTLYSFGASKTDGIGPQGVTLGNTTGTIIYGTTACGGTGTLSVLGDQCVYNGSEDGAGTIWKLSFSTTTEKWTESILYNFISDVNATGAIPAGTVLLNGTDLYGTTSVGGVPGKGEAVGTGVVYELSPSGSTWTLSVLHTFNVPAGDGGDEAGSTMGQLAMDTSKNIYGTTGQGGAFGNGTAWELVNNSGTYTEKILFSFGTDSGSPNWGLVLSGGSWYGSTGGWPSYLSNPGGSIFKLTSSTTGVWTERTIYSQFGTASDEVSNPGLNQLIVDTKGNLYGMGYQGGGIGLGGVFEVVPTP